MLYYYQHYINLNYKYMQTTETTIKEKQKLKFEKIGPMKLPSRIAGGTLDLYLYTFDTIFEGFRTASLFLDK